MAGDAAALMSAAMDALRGDYSRHQDLQSKPEIQADSSGEVPYHLIDDTDKVGKALRAVLAASSEPAEVRTAVISLLSGFPASGKAGKKWLAQARAVQDKLRDPVLLARSLVDAAIDAPDSVNRLASGHQWAFYVGRGNETLLPAVPVLAGLAARYDGGPAGLELLPRLRVLALKAITFIGEYGSPRSIRLANQCVQAIADAALPASVTELLRVERGTRHGALRKQVRKAVDALAASQGMERDELLERAVEDHGLSADGTRTVALAAGWTAVIEARSRTALVGYLAPNGMPRKSLPSPVKSASAEALTALQKEVKAVRATIGNERSRLDGLLAAGRRWNVAAWRELYLGHPVAARLARALIWQFEGHEELTGLPLDGTALLTADRREAGIPRDGEVRLWHPVAAEVDEVRAWRQLLLDWEIEQPVRQAFREVHTLTPAEGLTHDYSNRFAGHVFRQVQARALMKGRGWAPVPLAWWDDGIDHGVARREYRPAGAAGPVLRAEFFFDVASHEDMSGDLYAYVASDQVRFFDAVTGDAVPLAAVPPLVFTEAMRDVDLFIGVTSIGADPEWLDRGEGRRFDTYWHRYAFGDLGAGAEVRREVLAGLVPRLAIADRCTLQSRFLEVRGDLRTYRIHLGSGNILMSPNDQYLCIVAARGTQAGKLFLPFDDDAVLSMILSKAFLLAADSKITDVTITRQIRTGLPRA